MFPNDSDICARVVTLVFIAIDIEDISKSLGCDHFVSSSKVSVQFMMSLSVNMRRLRLTQLNALTISTTTDNLCWSPTII